MRGRLLLLASVVLVGLACGPALAGIVYQDPVGGWTYTYTGDSATYGALNSYDSLDGTWDHDNGSDEWDGTGPGSGRPGGLGAIDGYLRMQDTGDPRDYGLGDPGSNRKVYVAHSITNEVGSVGDTILDNGVTISFRARVATGSPLDDLHPDGGAGTSAWPAGGDGYVTHDGGKGNFSVRQSSGDEIISFSLALSSDTGGVTSDGLLMNNLNGNSPTGNVDMGEDGTVNILNLTATEWHEFWITIQADPSGLGTHLVNVYVDGSLTPVSFNVTAGTGNDYDDSYLGMGVGATPQSGAIDVDFYSYMPGVAAPVPEPASIALLGLGAMLLRRKRSKI